MVASADRNLSALFWDIDHSYRELYPGAFHLRVVLNEATS